MNRIKIFSVALGVLGLAGLALAVGINTNIPVPNPQGNSSPAGFVGDFYRFSLMISGVLAFGAIVYGGIKYILAAGNPSGQQEGKEWVKGALIGLLLLAGAYTILNIINPNITTLALPKLVGVEISAQQTPSVSSGYYACVADDGKYACSPGNKSDCSDASACQGKSCAQILSSDQCGGLAGGIGGATYGCIADDGKYACSPGNKSDCSDASACSGKSCTRIDSNACGTTVNSAAVSSGCAKDVAGTIYQCVAASNCVALTCAGPCVNYATTACNNATMGNVVSVIYACVADDGKYACSPGNKSDCSDASACSGKPCNQISTSMCGQPE